MSTRIRFAGFALARVSHVQDRHIRLETGRLVMNNELVKSKIYAGGNCEIETDARQQQRKLHYISGGDGLCAIYVTDDENSDGTMYYLLKDHLGSIYAVTSENGEIATYNGRQQIYSFDPWGRRRNHNDWTFQDVPTAYLFDRGFTKHEHLDELGLINMNGRMYEPWLGRFLSPDNYVQMPGYSQNLNRYSYVLNNPLKYTDPSGEFIWMPIIIGAAIGGFSGWQIGEAVGATGWEMVGYIAGGAAIGGLSGGAAAGVSAVGGGAMLAGASAGAVGGAGFSGLSTGWDGQAMLKGAAFGAISGFVGGGVGASIGGSWGAMAGGTASNLMGQLLYNGGDFSNINWTSVIVTGAVSWGIYQGMSFANWKWRGGNRIGDRKISYRQFSARNRDFQRSRFWKKEYGGWDMKDGSVRRFDEFHDLGTSSSIPKDAVGAYHAHWAKENITYFVDQNMDIVSENSPFRVGSVRTTRYHGYGDEQFPLPLTTINRYDGGSYSIGSNSGYIVNQNDYYLRFFLFPFVYK